MLLLEVHNGPPGIAAVPPVDFLDQGVDLIVERW